jgi:SMC interacting uncharacterized protein involved in chromosome segregation
MFRRSKSERTSKFKFGTSEVPFIPADASLDLMVQARENLNSFKSYLDHDPSDSGRHYDIVAQTMSRACSEFTNRTAELEIRIDQARTAANDIIAQEESIVQQKDNFCVQISAAESEESQLRLELESLQSNARELESAVENGEAQEKEFDHIRREYSIWKERHESLVAEYESEDARTKELAREESELRELLQTQSTGAEAEVAQVEARIRELAATVKVITARPDQPQKEEEAVAAQPELPAFVIQDSVHVSGGERRHLAAMVAALEEENAALAADVNSRMMDIDCLMQENLGLKQIIREIAENA